MGDGDAVSGAAGACLEFVPLNELRRLRGLRLEEADALFADACRLNALYMIKRAGSGHVGTSFSSMDILASLFLHELRLSGSDRTADAEDIFFSSKGHDAPAVYAVLIALERLPFDMIHRLRILGGLPGHPHVETPFIYANTGSLGMGISKAKGMLAANRLMERPGRVFVLLGDGELQEGQVWESLPTAARDRLDRLVAIVDHNKIQSDTWVRDVSDLGDIEAKFRRFGWHTERVDGHDPIAIRSAVTRVLAIPAKPKVIIADTVKGKGACQFEGTSVPAGEWRYLFHSGAPSDALYVEAVREIQARLDDRLARVGAPRLQTATLAQPTHRAITSEHRLVPAYTRALLSCAERDRRIVVLNADLAVDCGLVPFRDRFPERFVECGIAEQDMVSQAGGMAQRGLVPVVHSFAAFLSARPNEQIYNSATEGTKVVYVATLAGILPGGPGHSHQCVRDISSLGAIPGLSLIEPSCEGEVPLAVEQCFSIEGSAYLRLVSVAWDVGFRLPPGYRMVPGQGVELVKGLHAVVFGYGPVLLSEACKAAAHLESEGLGITVVNLPWLNRVDAAWLSRTIRDHRLVVTLDNHYVRAGQGEMLAAVIAESGARPSPLVRRFGVRTIPACGKNEEVLRFHRLDAHSLYEDIRAAILEVRV